MAAAEPTLTISWAGDLHLRVAYAGGDSAERGRRVIAAFKQLQSAAIPGLRDLTPAYSTLLLSFDPASTDWARAEEMTRRAVSHAADEPDPPLGRFIEIPVCYESVCAPDLAELARRHGLDQSEVVALHAASEYLVRFIGFSPGFPYLDGLPAQLATPRLDRPRTRVPAGSVGIAGAQCGIYPSPTPGGWNLIGRTPLRLFDPSLQSPALLAPGDRVRFKAVDLSEFQSMLARTVGEAA